MRLKLKHKKLDAVGRIQIPVELRRKLGINIGDDMDIFTDNDTIIIQKHFKSCVFCGNIENLTEYCQKNICSKCLENLKK